MYIQFTYFVQGVVTFLKKYFKKNWKSIGIIYSPPGNYMLKVNNRNTRTRCEICSKLTLKTQERRHSRRSGVC